MASENNNEGNLKPIRVVLVKAPVNVGPSSIVYLVLIVAFIFGLLQGADKIISMFHDAKTLGMMHFAEERFERYSDFAPVSAWPEYIRKEYSSTKYPFFSAYQFDLLPIKEQAKKGGVLWLALVSTGPQMRHSSGAYSFPNGTRDWKKASLVFLRRQCSQGLEIACLDAAKLHAGLVFKAGHRYDEAEVILDALNELPTTGPLSTSPAIEALRSKIKSDTMQSNWAWFKYRFFHPGE